MDRGTAVHYLTRKIAKIIYDTVECELKDRAESDWLAAEKIVHRHFNWAVGRMIGTPEPGDGSSEFSRSGVSSYEEFERDWGMCVWLNARPHRASLPRPPYGNITFS